MEWIIDPRASAMMEEPSCQLWIHKGLLCLISRNMRNGILCGYVAIDKNHPFHGKSYHDLILCPDNEMIPFNGNWMGLLSHSNSAIEGVNMVPIDLYLQAHGGITWSRDEAPTIDKDVFPDLWWFGFDCNHAGDLNPITIKYNQKDEPFWGLPTDVYRDFNYVLTETEKLAEQLASMIVTPPKKRSWLATKLNMAVRKLQKNGPKNTERKAKNSRLPITAKSMTVGT